MKILGLASLGTAALLIAATASFLASPSREDLAGQECLSPAPRRHAPTLRASPLDPGSAAAPAMSGPDTCTYDEDVSDLFPPSDRMSLADHLREVAEPTIPLGHSDCMPPFGYEALEELRNDLRLAYDSVRVLGAAGPSGEVDEVLVGIARRHEDWDSRFRALHVLILRGHDEVATLLASLVECPEAHVRCIAWEFCSRVGRRLECPTPVKSAWALHDYGEESVTEVAASIASYLRVIYRRDAIPVLIERVKSGPAVAACAAADALGHGRARDAIPTLLEKVRSGTPAEAGAATAALGQMFAEAAIPLLMERARTGTASEARSALGALGHMKVREAVPLLIQDNRFEALGQIGTPAAIAHLLGNLDRDGAVSALLRGGHTSAVPAMEAALAKMQALPAKDRRRYMERETRLAIVQLRPGAPCKALMDLMEAEASDDELRSSAAYVLRCHPEFSGQQAQEERLAGIYLREEAPGVREQCLMALNDSRARGVTGAMLKHALTWKPYLKTTEPRAVLYHLNRRLGTSFTTLDDVGRYVEEKRGAK